MDLRTREIVDSPSDSEYRSSMIEFQRRLTEAEKVRRKVGRNAPCPCGSGKKLKNCCLKRKPLT